MQAELTKLTPRHLSHKDTARDAVRQEESPGEKWLAECLKRMRVKGMFAEFVVITPAMATALLARNPDNRSIVASGVAEWAGTLARGDWKMNGESVVVADTGELNDGQHRLTAVVQTGISLPTLIVFGVTRDSRKTVDTGKKRTSGHVLGMSGVPQAALMAAALKVVINIEKAASINTHRTAQEIERAYREHPDLALYLTEAPKAARFYRQSIGLFVALHYMMAKKSPAKATEFFGMLASNVFPSTEHAAARLAQRLVGDLGAKAKLPIRDVAALTIKAWNAHRKGRTVGSLRWTTEGVQREAFPVIQ